MRFFIKNTKGISEKFGIPYTTLKGWEDKNDWRGELYDKLGLYLELEEDTLKKIKKRFSKSELKALWGSLKSTLITKDLIFSPDALAWGFEDYCRYEEMEAAQFSDNLPVFAKVIGEKLRNLTPFERYVLIKYLKENEKEIFN